MSVEDTFTSDLMAVAVGDTFTSSVCYIRSEVYFLIRGAIG